MYCSGFPIEEFNSLDNQLTLLSSEAELQAYDDKRELQQEIERLEKENQELEHKLSCVECKLEDLKCSINNYTMDDFDGFYKSIQCFLDTF